jgi:hypothetical protein
LIEAKSLRAEEAAFTSESVPSEKNATAPVGSTALGDREKMPLAAITLAVSANPQGLPAPKAPQFEISRIG